MMKKILAIILTSVMLSACGAETDRTASSSSKEENTPKPTQQGVFSPEDVVKQYRKAINQDDVILAQSFIGESVIMGILESDGSTDKVDTEVYYKDKMDITIETHSTFQQEYIKDEYIEKGDYWVIVEGYEPNYLTSMIWNLGREDYKIRTKYVVKNDYITEIYTMTNKEFQEIQWKKLAGVVGLECEVRDNELYVSSATQGLPAFRAGFIPGDKIISIDNMLVEDMRFEMNEHLYRLRGEVDTTVDVVVERDGKTYDYVLKRVAQ